MDHTAFCNFSTDNITMSISWFIQHLFLCWNIDEAGNYSYHFQFEELD